VLRSAVIALVALCATASAAPEPAAIAIVLDRSSAMTGERLPIAKEAVLELVDRLDSNDRVAVVTFGERATVAVKMQVPNRARVAAALDLVGSDGRTANVAAGIETALDLFKDARFRQRRVIVVTASDDATGVARVLDGHRDRHATLSTIALQLANPYALGDLFQRGEVRTIDDLVDLPGTLLALARAPTRPRVPARAIAYVIDRSGSMVDKIDLIKATVASSLDRLEWDDDVALIAFDSVATTLVRPTIAAHRRLIATELARIEHGGGTNIFPGLREAETVLDTLPNAEKHVVLLTDGGAPTDGISDLVTEMRSAGIVTDVVGFDGTASDRDTLQMIADTGGGRLMYIVDKDHLPDPLR
jgi:Mg-chelatase subunit ChlD